MEEKRLFCRWDAILVLCLLIIVITAACFTWTAKRDGGTVVIEINGETYSSLSLNDDTVLTVDPDGNGKDLNVIVIKDGSVYVREADCPSGRCTRHSPISRVGETVICLPHKLVVRIVE